MLKVEFIEEGGSLSDLIVNSKFDKPSNGDIKKNGLLDFLQLENVEVTDELINYSFEDIGKFIMRFYYKRKISNWDFKIEVGVLCYGDDDEISSEIIIQITPESKYWNKPYSILELSKLLEDIIINLHETSITYVSDFGDLGLYLAIHYEANNRSLIVKDEIDKIITLTEKILQKAQRTLLQNLDKDLITSYFNFPEEIKAACKQYLVYFAQFLMDLGIEADTEIKEETQRTLFKVIPKNKEESLDKIREALEVYLNIPKDFDIQVAQNNDVAVMQWQANVMHLKSQLMLVQSTLQMKDATIEALQLSNYQLKDILEKKTTEEKPKNEEEIAGGLVKVKELDVKGLSFNLPELLRRLKRRFK